MEVYDKLMVGPMNYTKSHRITVRAVVQSLGTSCQSTLPALDRHGAEALRLSIILTGLLKTLQALIYKRAAVTALNADEGMASS